jgi:ribosome-binding factor A
MSTNRIDKVNDLLQQQLALYFHRELEFPRDTLVTITRVEATKDLQLANIWLSILPINHSGGVLQVIKRNLSDLNKILRRQLFIKNIPRFIFRIDDTEEKAAVIEQMIEDLPR